MRCRLRKVKAYVEGNPETAKTLQGFAKSLGRSWAGPVLCSVSILVIWSLPGQG